MHDTCPHTYADIEWYTCCRLPRWSAVSPVPHPQTPRCRHRWCRYVPRQSDNLLPLIWLKTCAKPNWRIHYALRIQEKNNKKTYTIAQALWITLTPTVFVRFEAQHQNALLCEVKSADRGSLSNLVIPHSIPDFACSFEPLRAQRIRKSPALGCFTHYRAKRVYILLGLWSKQSDLALSNRAQSKGIGQENLDIEQHGWSLLCLNGESTCFKCHLIPFRFFSKLYFMTS